MRIRIALIAVLVVLAGCNGFLGGQQSPSIDNPDSEPNSSSADTTSSDKFNRNLQLHQLNSRQASSGEYELIRNTTSTSSDVVDSASVINVHKYVWGATGNNTESPSVTQSVVILLESEADVGVAKEEVLESYASDIDSTTDDKISTVEYETRGGFNSSIAVSSHKNLVFFSIEFGGDDHYPDLVRANTKRLLEKAESYQENQ